MKYLITFVLAIVYIAAFGLLAVYLYRSPIWLIVYLIINILIVVVYFYLKKDYIKTNTSIQEKFEFYFYFDTYVSLLFPFPFMILRIQHYFQKEKLRNKLIYSEKGEKMVKVNQKYNDRFLSKGQYLEQMLESVDYDVWITKAKDETRIVPFYNHLSHYKSCPKCSFQTFYQVYDKEIMNATYSDVGEGEIKQECKYCNHTEITTYIIAVLTHDDYDSSSSSGGSGSSSSGGGSSWGGGSGSGGGSSSNW